MHVCVCVSAVCPTVNVSVSLSGGRQEGHMSDLVARAAVSSFSLMSAV